jgi:hypothetical protein
MPKEDAPEQRLLAAIVKAKKDKLTVEDFVIVAKVAADARRDRL